MMDLSLAGAVIGGLGLFLLAVGMMTDGLRQAAGKSLRKILVQSTRTPYRGVLSGFLMTAIVQSSSAVTVASIGFVNAGLLSMRQALGVIYGSNIGTTITGWLVALIGFKLNIHAFALPMVGIGMIIRLVKREGRMAAAGMALVGFGLFFIGIDVLKGAFEGLVVALDITKIQVDGIAGILLFLLLGVVMTILMQSSSASIALTITAAATGVIGLYAAAAMVIGANVGTTSTAAIASIGATANAKRVALAQVLFNVGTATVALLLLPVLFIVVRTLEALLGLETEPAITLALFHSLFNVLGVLLVLPLNGRLATFLEGCFGKHEEAAMKPKYLDKTIAATPVLAVNALILELQGVAERVRQLVEMSIGTDASKGVAIMSEREIIRHLSSEVSAFIVNLERSPLSEETSHHLASLLRVDQYLFSCANDAADAFRYQPRLAEVHDEPVQKALHQYRRDIYALMDVSGGSDPLQALSDIQACHDAAKAVILTAGTEGRLPFDDMIAVLDVIGEQLRMTQQWFKAMRYLAQVREETRTNGEVVETLSPDDAPSHETLPPAD
ncbi:MAG: Na/Pi cotransporter family protein [Gammaproteobacteria bacterium]|nr:MAG: Na/Pi cotransporter family protein [Gammaproteobacteria bacterium]